jgi:hypothetical protein
VAINENRAIRGSIMDFFNGLPKDLQEVVLEYPMNEEFEFVKFS